MRRIVNSLLRYLPVFSICLFCWHVPSLAAQDWVHTGTNLSNPTIRIAAADFKPVGSDPQTTALKAVFDATLFSDLGNAGIFDVVSKSMAPQSMPGSPQEMVVSQWSAPPASAAMVAFGTFSADNGRLAVYGYLFDTGSTTNPQVLGKQYNEAASEDMARTVAHRFADEIIVRLGGTTGVAETKIYFVSNRTGTKEIWSMDYDGQNQRQVTHLGSISISPRVSPDNSRIAFSSLEKNGWSIRMYSIELGRMVSFPSGTAGGSNLSPAWTSDGARLAFSSSRSGDSAIWMADAGGGNLHKITSLAGPNVSPVWNPRTNAQIAFVGGRTNEPQIYTMNQDGSNIQRMTDSGYAVSPSWHPNGGLLAFSWNRKYGPGDPGGQDIYVFEIATMHWLQVTHESGNNDFPSWAPDGRHIVFQRKIDNRTQIWTMLADGTHQQQLTKAGDNSMPNWSWK